MDIIKTISDMRQAIKECRSRRPEHAGIGLVPTMGALHGGHLSLVERSASENGVTVASVFVNPIQFEDKKDFVRYSRNLENDARLAGRAGADIVFAPTAEEMYPAGFSSFIDLSGISEALCGASREFHFRGVCTVVGKLFHIVGPDRAYFGEKDAQQLAVVRKMAADLNFPVEVIGRPTVRDAAGLALSSRNARLSAQERSAARCLCRALQKCADLFDAGETAAAVLAGAMRGVIGAEPAARIDYAEIVDPITFRSADFARCGSLAALAVYFGETRLIDNLALGSRLPIGARDEARMLGADSEK
jgi:pantoate--beta-alanine ligase